jgi:cytochrome c556
MPKTTSETSSFKPFPLLCSRGAVSLLLSAAMLVAMSPAIALADDQDVVDYRQHVMKTIGEQTAALDEILQHRIPPDNFVTHVEVLAIAASTAKKAFEPKVLGGQSKPDVWAHWADFSKRLDDLAAATAELAKSARDGGLAATAPKIPSALTCKSCHDTYQQPKE